MAGHGINEDAIAKMMKITPANNASNAFLAAVAILAKATESPTAAQAD